MEFGSVLLTLIWGFYTAPEEEVMEEKRNALIAKFAQLEKELGAGPFFAGEKFSLVDCFYAPVFRYFDVFEAIHDFGFDGFPRLREWRWHLGNRPAVINAVPPDYAERLIAFLREKECALSRRITTEVLKTLLR